MKITHNSFLLEDYEKEIKKESRKEIFIISGVCIGLYLSLFGILILI